MGSETEVAAAVCVECGGEVPVVESLGFQIPLRYCPPCGAAAAARDADEERARVVERALDLAGATPRLLGQSLETYPADGAPAVAVARAWIDDYRGGERRNLWLTGAVGRGKTGLAWGIVRALALAEADAYLSDPDLRGGSPRSPALFVIWRDLLADLREAISSGDDVAASLFDRAQRVAVLALDDLGAERPTPYALESLSTLVEHRYQRRSPTIVTSNFGTRDLAARLGHDDPQLGRRIVDRLVEGAVGHQFEGASRRRAGTP
jgi:DNA replication protein DnaC